MVRVVTHKHNSARARKQASVGAIPFAKTRVKKLLTKPVKKKSPRAVKPAGFVLVAFRWTKAEVAYWSPPHFDTDARCAHVFTSEARVAAIAKRLLGKMQSSWHLASMRAGLSDAQAWEELRHFHGEIGANRQRNPVAPLLRRAKLANAGELYAEFTGHTPEHVDTHTWDVPDVAAKIGECDGVMYTTVRDGKTEKYLHKFAKKSRPLLAVSSDGQQLVLVGGKYQFTEAGIEDR